MSALRGTGGNVREERNESWSEFSATELSFGVLERSVSVVKDHFPGLRESSHTQFQLPFCTLPFPFQTGPDLKVLMVIKGQAMVIAGPGTNWAIRPSYLVS